MYNCWIFLFLITIGFSVISKDCDPENAASFLKDCSAMSEIEKKQVKKIKLWQGTSHEGYQLLDCQNRRIKNVIESTGESYSCSIPKDYTVRKRVKNAKSTSRMDEQIDADVCRSGGGKWNIYRKKRCVGFSEDIYFGSDFWEETKAYQDASICKEEGGEWNLLASYWKDRCVIPNKKLSVQVCEGGEMSSDMRSIHCPGKGTYILEENSINNIYYHFLKVYPQYNKGQQGTATEQ